MTRAQNKPLRDAQKSVIKQIRGDPKKNVKGDGQLGLRFLERRMPKRYKTQIETRDITPPSRNFMVGTPKPHKMFRPDEEPTKGKGGKA